MNENNEQKIALTKLADAVKLLGDNQKKEFSLRWNFWRGVFYGFGFFIGSAILAAILIYILTRFAAGNNAWSHFFQKIADVIANSRH